MVSLSAGNYCVHCVWTQQTYFGIRFSSLSLTWGWHSLIVNGAQLWLKNERQRQTFTTRKTNDWVHREVREQTMEKQII